MEYFPAQLVIIDNSENPGDIPQHIHLGPEGYALWEAWINAPSDTDGFLSGVLADWMSDHLGPSKYKDGMINYLRWRQNAPQCNTFVAVNEEE